MIHVKAYINVLLLVMLSSISLTAFAADPVKVLMQTSKGPITLELYPDKAPKTVENFVNYTNAGFYDGTIFHRVIDNFMIQGGGFDQQMNKKATRDAIPNEADNGLKNDFGTIAMARTPDPHSATAQFFINTKNNTFLNHTRKTANGWGYAVFGKVTDGSDTVKQISQVKTGVQKGMRDVPVEEVVIEKVTIIK